LAKQIEVAPVAMDFAYAESFGGVSRLAYETLLLDVMIGDATLFTRSDEVEAAWMVVDPLLSYWVTTLRHRWRPIRPAVGGRRPQTG